MGNNLNVCHTEEVKKGENSRMKEAKENLTVSGTTGEAMVSMIICMIILIIFIIFFCLLPLYRLLERRWSHWDQVENDPRWNVDTFQFSASAAANKHSRQNSYRQHHQPPAPPYHQQLEEIQVPRAPSLGSPPPYTSVDSGIENRNVRMTNKKDLYFM